MASKKINQLIADKKSFGEAVLSSYTKEEVAFLKTKQPYQKQDMSEALEHLSKIKKKLKSKQVNIKPSNPPSEKIKLRKLATNRNSLELAD